MIVLYTIKDYMLMNDNNHSKYYHNKTAQLKN